MIRVEAHKEFGQSRYRVYEWQRKLESGGYGDSRYEVFDRLSERRSDYYRTRIVAEDEVKRLNQEYEREDQSEAEAK